MHRTLPFLLVLLTLCAAGCTTNRATVRSANKIAFAVLKADAKRRAASVTSSGEVANVQPQPLISARQIKGSAEAVAPQPKTITLAWDNPNPSSWPLLTEIHSTTDLRQPFALKAEVPPGVYTLTLEPTNRAEFFICRFVDPATGEVSPWNVK